MSKPGKFIKRIVKVSLWVVFGIVMIFILVALIIQIPSVQNRIIDYAASYVSGKTNTKVEIKNIGISFPKAIALKGIYLEDTQSDTLFYAGLVKVNIALFDLLSSKINIASFALEDATIKLYSSQADPLFNYNFLITSFSDTTKQVDTTSAAPSKWTFSIDKVKLKNVLFTYNDVYGGIGVFAAVAKSAIRVQEIAPEKSLYAFNELLLSGLSVIVQRSDPTKSQPTNPESIPPKIVAKKLQISKSSVTYNDSVSYMSVVSVIEQLGLEDASIDIQKELLLFDQLTLAKSDIRYHDSKEKMATATVVSDSLSPSGSNWKVTANRLNMDDNVFIYQVGDTAEAKNEFNPKYLYFKHLIVDANDFHYEKDLINITIEELSLIDQHGFEINSLETNFQMDETSITTDKLKLKTPNTTIDADFHLQFSSLESFSQDFEFSKLNLVMREVNFKSSDPLYFSNDLIKLPFFANNSNTTNISGTINGPLDNLTGKSLVIRTGKNTLLKTDFSITGLPDVKKASYNFPNLKVISGKKDLEMLAGPSIPENIELPEKLNLDVVFKGKITAFESTLDLNSSFGAINLDAWVDKDENFSAKLSVNSFDAGLLLKDTVLYGPVSLTAEAAGQGLDKETVMADIKAEVTQFYFNSYTYHNLSLDGTLFGQEFSGKINLDDEYAVFNFEGLVGLNPGMEFYQFRLDVPGANLQKLNFTKDDIRVGLMLSANFQGRTVDKLYGEVGINKLTVAQGEQVYVLDSLLFTSVNEPAKSEFILSSPLVDATYTGTISPIAISSELTRFINQYFPLTDEVEIAKNSNPADFSFDIQLHNHPILSEILLPQLNVFQPGIIQGSYSSEANDLKIHAILNKIVYGTTEITDLVIDVKSDAAELLWSLSSSAVSNDQVKLDNFLLEGKMADNTLFANLSSIDEDQRKKILIRSQITKPEDNYKLTFNLDDLFLMYNRWNINPENYIEFSDKGFLIHKLFLKNTVSQINIASVNQEFNDDLNIELVNFKLDDISRLIEKDSSFVKGTLDGNILLKRVNNTYGVIADATINELLVKEVPVGDVTIKTTNPKPGRFDLEVNVSGQENKLTAEGYFIANEDTNSIQVKTAIQSLSMKTVEAFSMGQLSESAGTLSGDLTVQGSVSSPEITGDLVFNDVFVKPAVLNNRLHISNETIQFKPGGIYFSSFTLTDKDQNSAIIDGSVQMNKFSDFVFALKLESTDFLLLNTNSKDNENYYGRMIIDSKINIKGPLALPVIDGRVRIKRGSNFTFVVPENRLTTDKGDDIVEFNSPKNMSPILYQEGKPEAPGTGFTGFDLSTIVEIDKQATLRLLMDPTSTDSLVVRGEAALSFSIDRSGKMSLTGAYNLDEGSYLVSLESVVKRKFDILSGSTIIWNGDPLDAVVSINARYVVRAAPYDLVAHQMAGMTAAESGGYKQQYPFWVLLKLNGGILQPVISFEIQLPPEEKGILGGAVNQKLNMLNEDVSALNKQVFALLVLGRFIQENPLQTASGGTSTLVRSTVGKFLSAQLNQLTSKVLPGVEMNFDIQSYEDYQSGEAEGRTQVEIGIKKQLFNERLSVQLGGAIDVEGERARTNQATDIASDIQIEYRLTKDGRYRLKGFRHNQYEGAIEGQLVETGFGIVYVRDFNQWKDLFRKPQTKSDSTQSEQKP
ncbi:MAG: translocation/assembly module TamB domain-containing protein [Bacteroidetes bacterium]|jgi:hypothetical protein|nr:translocation/assembly module TamB domain-containing protein [Bacteroidota bacterium]